METVDAVIATGPEKVNVAVSVPDKLAPRLILAPFVLNETGLLNERLDTVLIVPVVADP